MIADNACVSFSNGMVHLGKEKIQLAFEHNFAQIKNEQYLIKNVVWIKQARAYAVYIFEFHWTGRMKGKAVGGKGIGTSVIIREEEQWRLLSEHLGRR